MSLFTFRHWICSQWVWMLSLAYSGHNKEGGFTAAVSARSKCIHSNSELSSKRTDLWVFTQNRWHKQRISTSQLNENKIGCQKHTGLPGGGTARETSWDENSLFRPLSTWWQKAGKTGAQGYPIKCNCIITKIIKTYEWSKVIFHEENTGLHPTCLHVTLC